MKHWLPKHQTLPHTYLVLSSSRKDSQNPQKDNQAELTPLAEHPRYTQQPASTYSLSKADADKLEKWQSHQVILMIITHQIHSKR